MPKFILHGQEYSVGVKDVEQAAQNMRPAPISKYTHVVEIQGKKYPILPLIAETLRVSKNMLIPLDAYKILDELGYSIRFYR